MGWPLFCTIYVFFMLLLSKSILGGKNSPSCGKRWTAREYCSDSRLRWQFHRMINRIESASSAWTCSPKITSRTIRPKVKPARRIMPGEAVETEKFLYLDKIVSYFIPIGLPPIVGHKAGAPKAYQRPPLDSLQNVKCPLRGLLIILSTAGRQRELVTSARPCRLNKGGPRRALMEEVGLIYVEYHN